MTEVKSRFGRGHTFFTCQLVVRARGLSSSHHPFAIPTASAQRPNLKEFESYFGPLDALLKPVSSLLTSFPPTATAISHRLTNLFSSTK